MISNEQKQQVWKAYRDRKPTRVPVTYGVNVRVVVLDPKWNPSGITFEQFYSDAKAAVEVLTKFMEYQFEYLHHYCDNPLGLPQEYALHVDNQNTYDAAYFGCPVHFRDGQVPDAGTILEGANKDKLRDFDPDHPLDNPFIRRCLRRHEDLKAAAEKLTYRGVKFTVAPPLLGFDGPLTIAACLRGTEIFCDLVEDPPYARRLMEFIQRAVATRNRALAAHFGKKAFEGPTAFLADDSIQLISAQMYRELILPLHKAWYANWAGPGPHGIHLCGDATRHFATIMRECNVKSFDTGFPVDHGALRKELGEDVEIAGGPPVALLLSGTPQEVHERTRQILTSGVMAGGRFILREANNLPPCVPEENLAAMCRCCLEHGNYDHPPQPPA